MKNCVINIPVMPVRTNFEVRGGPFPQVGPELMPFGAFWNTFREEV